MCIALGFGSFHATKALNPSAGVSMAEIECGVRSKDAMSSGVEVVGEKPIVEELVMRKCGS